jgi:hypothetical protein
MSHLPINATSEGLHGESLQIQFPTLAAYRRPRHRHARAGTIASFLVDRFGAEADFNMMEPEDWTAISELWFNLDNAVDARRKFGVENKGIALLMAYALESFQSLDREEKKSA